MSSKSRKSENEKLARESSEDQWDRFIRSRGAVITQCGLPAIYYESASHWDDFVTHGFLHLHSGNPNDFDLAALPRENLQRLHDFVLHDYLEGEGIHHSELYKILRNILGTMRKRFDEYAEYWQTASKELLTRSCQFQSEWWDTILWQKCQATKERFFDDSAKSHFVVSLDAFFESLGIEYRLSHKAYMEFVRVLEGANQAGTSSNDNPAYWSRVREKMNDVLEKHASMRVFASRQNL